MKETDIVKRLQQICPSNDSVQLGIGDDAAVIKPSRDVQLVCKDMLLEGVHFLLDDDPYWAGHKALAVNLSDIAAMGGVALSAYVALAIPRRLNKPAFLERLYEGLGSLAATFDVSIAGGDTNIWDGPFVISVTVLGVCHQRGPVTRAGAQEGDVIFVTGPLGDSYASGHHLRFTPRLSEAKALLDRMEVHSMIDLSDGLGKDLRLVAEQSGLCARLVPENIPLRASLAGLDRAQALQRALCDGEDFELCFTVSAAAAELLKEPPFVSFCRPIGRMTSGQGLVWDKGRGGVEIIEARGYEHQ